MKWVFIIILAVAILGGGYVYKKNSNTTSNSSPATSQTQPSDTTQANGTTITYSDSGFSPSSISVNAGTMLTIVNTSGHSLQLDSDPHPAHTDDTDLNIGVISAGKSVTFTVSKQGSFGYHNHLNPSQTGAIVVK